MEAALPEAGARGVRGGGDEEPQAVLRADERPRKPLQHGAVGLGGAGDLELGPEVDVHEDPLALAAVAAGREEDVDVGVLAGRVGGGLFPAGDAERSVVAAAARAAEGRCQEPEQAPLPRPRRAVVLHERGDVRQEVPLPETRAADETLECDQGEIRNAGKFVS